MKPETAWAIIDLETGRIVAGDYRPHIYWARAIAKRYADRCALKTRGKRPDVKIIKVSVAALDS